MQDYEIRAFLGDGWTEDQIQQVADMYRRMEPDTLEDGREHLLTAIAQHVDGVLDRGELLRADVAAQVRAAQARNAVRNAARVEIAAGMSESEAARLYGVDRMTVRKWLGKR